jgi:hypothetical protein
MVCPCDDGDPNHERQCDQQAGERKDKVEGALQLNSVRLS